MIMRTLSLLLLALSLAWAGCMDPNTPITRTPARDADTLRIATYNIEDVRTAALLDANHPRLKAAAARVQRLRPDILLLNEIAYDEPGAPDVPPEAEAGQNGQRFADNFLAVAQGPDLQPIRYHAFTAPSNTGQHSGLDLNRDGRITPNYPPLPPLPADGQPNRQTEAGRAYGDDSWGFGTYPGQYGMVLLVREGLEILHDSARTFQHLHWERMPAALQPALPDSTPWYDIDTWQRFPLSSKSHWDVPVRLPGGAILHVFASHPTPPAFDGEEERNKRRNHDEIRFWSDYLNGAAYIVDDQGNLGGYHGAHPFVILGDLNADPDEGSSIDDPIGTFLLSHDRINGTVAPQADDAGQTAFPDLDPDDTARWGRRVDYVLPSTDVEVLASGVWRPAAEGLQVSDHFPVWLDAVFDAVSIPPAPADTLSPDDPGF